MRPFTSAILPSLAALTAALLPAQAAVAQADSASPPTIIAPTSTAPFSATRGPIRFDRACGNLTFETLPADAGCSARIGRGETGPTLEVIARTLSEGHTQENIRAALAMLDRAIATEDHAAAYYLAGSLLATGEVEPPDYPRAITFLERAVARGNAAAADLLAILVLEGRGTAKDPARAARLFGLAAAGGMEGSATRLAHLYLTGRDLPANPALARQILDRAAAAGVLGAAQLLLMLDGDSLVHNYQLHPNEDPARVEVRQYRTFDNPEIPPTFGFTDEFQRVHYAAYSDPDIRTRLERDRPGLPTPYLFELARRTVQVSVERARGYYLLAKLRMTYDARRCADGQALEAIPAWDRLVAGDLRPALRGMSADELAAAVAFALEQDQVLPPDTRPWWVCYSGMASYSGYSPGQPLPLRLVPETEWPRLRQEIRDAIAGIRLPPQPAPPGSR
ncbi:MAG: tetratricopeptide repeat protein [Allosphingosinicella sp.]